MCKSSYSLVQNFVDMRGISTVFDVSCLTSIIYSASFIVLDQGTEADPLDNSLYFTSTDQTTGDGSVSYSIAVGSVIESPF